LIPKMLWRDESLGVTESSEGETIETFRTVFDGWEYIPTGSSFPVDESGYVDITYRPVNSDTADTYTHTVESLTIDVTPRFSESITVGSLCFSLGESEYVHTAGAIYRDPSLETGAGAMAGTLNISTGQTVINDWIGGGANTVSIKSLITEVGGQPVDEVTFRTPLSPIKPGVFQMRFIDRDGNVYTKTPDTTGHIEDGDCTINIDFTRGIVHARFGLWRQVNTLTAEELAADWYDARKIVTITVGDEKVDAIWKSLLVRAESIIYNAVAATYLPPDSELLGLDAARLPPDGQALIYQRGMLALVHNTDTKAVATLSPSQVIDCGRTRLYRASITDSVGEVLSPAQYIVDRAAGLVTMSATLDLTGFTAPWVIHHTVADLLRVTDTDINGSLTFMSALTHNYPSDNSYCSGVLYAGTRQARVSNLFAQSAWDTVWQDTLRGTAPLADYNDALYPIIVTNEGAYPDRILVRFVSATEFQVIGENLGFIATGTTDTNCEPVNLLTGKSYFKIDFRGWGGGWATGNCLRFNLHGAAFPVDLVRAIQPSEPGAGTDCFELLLIGNIAS
jgi:hypothetical protein